MDSRASSASDGEVLEPQQQKAITNHQPAERTINNSNRAFGLKNASKSYGVDHKSRDLSRSPSPYRHKHNRSTSPLQYHRKRDDSRSPSPYRHKRDEPRSPSPYRHKRDDSRSPSPYRHSSDHVPDANASRSQHKRKGSPRGTSRPDKRHQTDRSRYNDRPPKSHLDSVRAVLHSTHTERRQARPFSYADNEVPPSVPDFRNGLKVQNGSHHHQRSEHQRGSQDRGQPAVDTRATASSVPASEVKDVDMTSPGAEPDDSHNPASEEKAPQQETREEKRRRWAAIRAAAEKEKPKENLLQQALLANASENTSPIATTEGSASPSGSPRLGHLDSVPASPDIMLVDKLGGVSESNSPTACGPSAADYDPTKDMLDDRDRAAKKAQQSEMSADTYSETDPKLLSTLPTEKVAPVKKQKKEKDDFDMFDFDEDNDNDDDDNNNIMEEEVNDNAKGVVLDEKLLDNWDDAEGYYKIISNELVNDGRYRMIKGLGRGVFANVAQAEDLKVPGEDGTPNLVAIKIIRRNDLMRVASQKEMDFVRKVNDADPQDKRHIVRLFSSFDHKGHLCGVFEHMSKNLRDLLKEDTNGHGISFQAIRVYARQMFDGLLHLQKCQVVHCDLKPDNILVSHDQKTVKLCDFGTAVDKRDVMDRTEYLVSRFYRAPEIILGMEIGYGIDMWAIGCTLYELWTGKILFTGRTNNQMVKAFMDCLGWPSEKLLKKGLLQNVLEHFEAGPPLNFISREIDQHGNVSVRKIEQPKKITRDLRTRVNGAAHGIAIGGPTSSELNDFAELLGACLNLNPEKRVEPKDALLHRFFPQAKPAPKKPIIKQPMKSVVKPAMTKRGAAIHRK